MSVKHVMLASCFVILLAFFMPWFSIFGIGASGYNISNLVGSDGYWLWSIPTCAGLTLLGSLGNSVKQLSIMGIVTGSLPPCLALYMAAKMGGDRDLGGIVTIDLFETISNIASIGVWLTIISSIVALVTSIYLLQNTPPPELET